jgi:hypothetical protein
MLATATRVTGVGDMAADILGHPRLEGNLQLTGTRLTGTGLVFTSDKANGLVDGDGDLATGGWVVLARGGMLNYLIPGFGAVDALTQLRIVPGPDGHGTMTTGTAQGWVRRLDNRFLSWVSGGLPRAETNLTRGPDRIVHFSNLRVTSPKVSFAGTGLRRTDATYSFTGIARHADYGPARLTLDGRLERPRLALRLDRPVDALGLANVVLTFEPSPAGYGWRAEGGSTLGPFTGTGNILLPPRGQAIIQVAALNVSGTRASGALRLDPHAFTGRLAVAGGGLDGELLFGPYNNRQRVAVNLTANEAHFYGPPPIVIRRATIEGVVLLDPAGNSIEGRVAARGVSRGPLSIANVEASASLRGGVGRINRAHRRVARPRFHLQRRRRRRAGPLPGQRQRHARPKGAAAGDSGRADLDSGGLAAGADAGELRRRQRQRLRPVRGADRGRRSAGRDAAHRARHRLAAARPRRDRLGQRALPLAACRRAAERRGQFAGARADPGRPRPVVAADGHRRQRAARRIERGDARDRGERGQGDRPGAGAGQFDRRAGPVRRATRPGADAGADPL